MLQWAIKVLQACETLCLDVQCQKWTNVLPFQFTNQRLDLKVSSGLHHEQPAASVSGASGSEWKKVSYATHIINWNRFITKMFLSKCTWGFFLPAELIDWMSWSCRENQNIYFTFPHCITDWEHVTLKLSFLPLAFFSGFSKLVSQEEGSHCFSYLLKNGRFSSLVRFSWKYLNTGLKIKISAILRFYSSLRMSGVEALMPVELAIRLLF